MLCAIIIDYYGFISMARKNTPEMLDISAQQLSDINTRISVDRANNPLINGAGS